jgi:hypothetical protein
LIETVSFQRATALFRDMLDATPWRGLISTSKFPEDFDRRFRGFSRMGQGISRQGAKALRGQEH